MPHLARAWPGWIGWCRFLRSPQIQLYFRPTDGVPHLRPASSRFAGIQTSDDYRFYAISAEYPEFSNKDKTLTLQFSVKHELKLDCGGGYVKLLRGDVDQKKFDICGYSTKKVHTNLTKDGKNHLIKLCFMQVPDQIMFQDKLLEAAANTGDNIFFFHIRTSLLGLSKKGCGIYGIQGAKLYGNSLRENVFSIDL